MRLVDGRPALTLFLGVIACGSSSSNSPPAPLADAGTTAPSCTTLSGGLPRSVVLATDTLGSGDPSFAHDPSESRTWMTYSSVATGPGNLRLVSTRLAYTDDGGDTFCSVGVVNASTAINPPPPGITAAAYWNHEVSQLLYDPQASANERWRLYWSRYVIANTGGSEEGQFQYSWISAKYAATPTDLPNATEHKLLAAAGYQSTFGDTVLGPPEGRIGTLDPSLSDCVALTEPGLLATTDARWLAVSCMTGNSATSRIVLLSDHRAGAFSCVSRLLGQPEAQRVNAKADGINAASLFADASGNVFLFATPTVASLYSGCVEYALSLPFGTLVNSDPAKSVPAATSFAGACAYDTSLGAHGVAMLQADITKMPPTFQVIETGVIP